MRVLGRRVAILTSGDNWHVAELRRALTERACDVTVLPVREVAARVGGRPAVWCRDTALDDCDAVVVRHLPGGTAEQIVYRMDVLQTLERRGVRVVNSARAIERSVDKYLTSALLAEAGLPTPVTVAVQGFAEAMAAFAAMGDVVAKPLFGSEGRGMVRLTDADTAYRVFRAWEQIGAIYYLQQYIPHANHDYRALVIGDRVVAAMERRAAGWKTNVRQGGEPLPAVLPPAWADLAVRAARAVGAEYAGVDLLPVDDGQGGGAAAVRGAQVAAGAQAAAVPGAQAAAVGGAQAAAGAHAAAGQVLVIEVNAIPGWAGLQRTTDLDIAGLVADRVLEGRS